MFRRWSFHMPPADDVGPAKGTALKTVAGERGVTAPEPGPSTEIDYEALADEVARDYPKILARLAE